MKNIIHKSTQNYLNRRGLSVCTEDEELTIHVRFETTDCFGEAMWNDHDEHEVRYVPNSHGEWQYVGVIHNIVEDLPAIVKSADLQNFLKQYAREYVLELARQEK